VPESEEGEIHGKKGREKEFRTRGKPRIVNSRGATKGKISVDEKVVSSSLFGSLLRMGGKKGPSRGAGGSKKEVPEGIKRKQMKRGGPQRTPGFEK